jgi:hypothetical protein
MADGCLQLHFQQKLLEWLFTITFSAKAARWVIIGGVVALVAGGVIIGWSSN